MKEINVEELRKIQIDILKYFSNFCNKNNLRYSLCGGTLLGAVRHHGYIPWDDDIDVMMPRTDYFKLLKLVTEFNNCDYEILAPSFSQFKLPFTYLKICDKKTVLIEKPESDAIEYSVYIDVFPIDGLPDDYKSYVAKLKKISTVYIALMLSKYKRRSSKAKNKILWNIIYYLSWILKPYKIMQQIENYVMKYDYDSCKYVGNVTSGYGLKEVNSKLEYGRIELIFEGEKYSVVTQYEDYLTNLYGDYMELPPEEKQVRCHDFLAYFNE